MNKYITLVCAVIGITIPAIAPAHEGDHEAIALPKSCGVAEIQQEERAHTVTDIEVYPQYHSVTLVTETGNRLSIFKENISDRLALSAEQRFYRLLTFFDAEWPGELQRMYILHDAESALTIVRLSKIGELVGCSTLPLDFGHWDRY